MMTWALYQEHIFTSIAPAFPVDLCSIMATTPMAPTHLLQHSMPIGPVFLNYLVSSRETVFSMKLLHQVNANIVIGQLSFKQCADVYNFIHEYTTDM